MQNEPLKVAVCDTFAGERWLSERYVSTFPNATFVHHEVGRCPDAEPHPHGAMVASTILLPVIDLKVEVHFVRFLDSMDRDSDAALLDVLRGIGPFHVMQNSWGQSPDRRKWADDLISTTWMPWIEREAALRRELGYLCVASSGNEDTGGLAFHDHCHPWRGMEGVVSIGSVDRRGLTTEWSSEGTKLVGVAGGERRWLLEPSGEWVLGDGTSFSSPAVAGLYLSLVGRGLVEPTYESFRAWWMASVVDIPGVRLPDPKMGWLNFEPHYQRVAGLIGAFDIAQVPSLEERARRRVKWLDLRRVS